VGLRVILAEAELELVPQEIVNHPLVRRQAQVVRKEPGQLVLDQNHHGPAMAQLPESERRGRPDITHYALLALLESPLCRAGGLEVVVHTRNRRLMRVRSDTRLPRGEARFQGVISRVLYEGASHETNPLLWIEGRLAPQQVLERFAEGPVLRLDEHGPFASPLQIADSARDGRLTVVIGAFPHGDWGQDWTAAAPTSASIWPDALNAWAVAAEVAAAFRFRHGPHRPPAQV
jgi:rRNA small subunit pseudouridine methyltransferase Nep1